MNSDKSKILVKSLILAALGFLGYIVFRKEKSYKEECDVSNETQESSDKIQTVNDIAIYDYSTPEELMVKISKDILTDERVSTPSEFLDTLASRFIISCNDYELAENLPRDIESLEYFFQLHGLFGKYKDIIENKRR